MDIAAFLEAHSVRQGSAVTMISNAFKLLPTAAHDEEFSLDALDLLGRQYDASHNEKKTGTLGREELIDFALDTLKWHGVKTGTLKRKLGSLKEPRDPFPIFVDQNAGKFNKDGTPKEPKLVLDKLLLTKYLEDRQYLSYIDGDLSVYNGHGYITQPKHIRRVIADTLRLANVPQLPGMDDFIKTLYAQSHPEYRRSSPFLIPAANGIIKIDPEAPSLETCELLPHHPMYHVTNPLPVSWNPRASCPQLDRALEAWADYDPDIYAILCEVGGMVLYDTDDFKKCFLAYGERNCGKSSYLMLLKAMTGRENTAAHGLADFDKPFRQAMLKGVRLNAPDDLEAGYISKNAAALLKKLISGEEFIIEEKYMDAETFKPRAKWIMACNTIPKFDDPALLDRFIIVPFLHSFERSNFRETLSTDPAALERMLLLSVEALCCLISRMNDGKFHFTQSDKVKKLTAEFRESCNPVEAWLGSQADMKYHLTWDAKKPDRKTRDELFEEFRQWAADSNINANITRDRFTKTILSKYKDLSFERTLQGMKADANGNRKQAWVFVYQWRNPDNPDMPH